MCHINFDNGTSYYGYGPGVNAANLTSLDIANANAKLKPQRQQRIQDGSLKAVQGDNKLDAASKSACDVAMTKYSSWTRKELCKAVVERRIKSRKTVARM
jgi:hypothetical protein